MKDADFEGMLIMFDHAAEAVDFKGGIEQVNKVSSEAKIARAERKVDDLHTQLVNAQSTVAAVEKKGHLQLLKHAHDVIQQGYAAVLAHSEKIDADLVLARGVIKQVEGRNDNAAILELLVRPQEPPHSAVYVHRSALR
jgi:hypothetical protein